MSSAREKRLLLGALALMAPLPLPLNGVVVWPIVLLYFAATSWFLVRAWEDRKRWLPFWAMNLLGLLYLPIFVADLLVLSRQGLVRPVVHLAFFTVVVKLFSLQRERDKWQALIGIFFLFLAGMATSVHLSVVLYLLAFLSLSLILLARFASLHLLTGFGRERMVSVAVPLRGILAFSLLLSVLVAVPLFALLPRVRTPYLATSGFGAGPSFEISGLSDEVTLDSIGLVRTSREVALRIEFEDPQRYLDDRGSLRFKATTFDRYRGNRWERTSRQEMLYNPHRRALSFELADEPAEQWAEIWLQPLNTRSLVVPVETARVEIDRQNLQLSRGGALSVPGGTRRNVLGYRVGLAARPQHLAPPPQEDDSSLDLSGVTPEISSLAAKVLGDADSLSDRERVQRLEQHLQTQYQYTLDFVGRSAQKPIEEFLFRSRSGHCEYFATSMVLLLRSQAIPSRLVTGFLGAETNLLQGYYVVRQENAHAWVEAYLADEGRWETFDPTPPVGRPGLRNTNLWSVALQAYDFLQFRWDRYVLSYDFDDQLSIFGRLRQAWSELWGAWKGSEETSAAPAETGEEAPSAPSGEWSRPQLPVVGLIALTLAIALVYIAVLLWRRWRRPLTAASAYQRLRWEMERDGLGVSEVDPPLALKATALSRWPEAAGPTGRVFDFYLQESYAGRTLDSRDREDLQASLGEALRRLRKAG